MDIVVGVRLSHWVRGLFKGKTDARYNGGQAKALHKPRKRGKCCDGPGTVKNHGKSQT